MMGFGKNYRVSLEDLKKPPFSVTPETIQYLRSVASCLKEGSTRFDFESAGECLDLLIDGYVCLKEEV